MEDGGEEALDGVVYHQLGCSRIRGWTPKLIFGTGRKEKRNKNLEFVNCHVGCGGQ
jgi:hypothetical protein